MEVDASRGGEHSCGAQVVARTLELLGPPALDALGLGLFQLLDFGNGHPYLQSCLRQVRPATPIGCPSNEGSATVLRTLGADGAGDPERLSLRELAFEPESRGVLLPDQGAPGQARLAEEVVDHV